MNIIQKKVDAKKLNGSLPKLVVILGPTAAGKSELAYRLSLDYGFEIISADSLLVYKYLNIGTAKPDKYILKKIPHHLIDIIDPSEEYNVGKFNEMTNRIINRLHSASKKILVVGGTYLYIKILTEGLIENIQTDKEFRKLLKEERRLYGNHYIYEKLKMIDPVSADKINSNDYVRMERALEVYHLTGFKLSDLQKNHGFRERRYEVLKLGLHVDKLHLDKFIEARTNNMLDRGLVSEVEDLLDKGYSKDIKPLKSIGYKEVLEYLSGEIDIENMKRLIIKNTKRLAKKQMTWLKRDKEIKWFNYPYIYHDVKMEIDHFYNIQ